MLVTSDLELVFVDAPSTFADAVRGERDKPVLSPERLPIHRLQHVRF